MRDLLNLIRCIFIGVSVANSILLGLRLRSGDEHGVLALLNLVRWMLLDLFRSRSSLEAEVIVVCTEN
jgi:hypothetical protein